MSTTAKRHHGYGNVAYAAEARAIMRAYPRGVPTLVPVEARRFAEQVIAEQGWEPVAIEFYTGRPGGGWAYDGARGGPRLITMSRRDPNRLTVVHEIAHVATPDDRGHGHAFRTEHLRLCKIYLPGFARSLAAAYRWHGASFDEVPS